MSRFALFGILALIATVLNAQETDDSFEVEPPLLPQNLKNDSAQEKSAAPAPVLDVAKLEKDLERAQRSAASAERLYKMGALAKVEAESRALRVVRLQSDLESARLARAKEEALAQETQTNANATSTEGDLARAIQAAHAAAAKREQAEVEAAEINLFRQQKLLALGSGSKASVHRAEEKLVEVKAPKD
jgi:hypothetical protein